MDGNDIEINEKLLKHTENEIEVYISQREDVTHTQIEEAHIRDYFIEQQNRMLKHA